MMKFQGCALFALQLLLHTTKANEFPSISIRAIDGSDGNEGAEAGSHLMRYTWADYPGDGSGSTMRSSPELPNARVLSNECHKDRNPKLNSHGLTDMVWAFGQFLDHDIDFTPGSMNAGIANIPIPQTGDVMGTEPMEFVRAHFDSETTGKPGVPRAHINEITGVIDGSAVYGSDEVRARALRSLEGGQLKVSNPNSIISRHLPPFNTEGLTNEGGHNDTTLFLFGDPRGNEQVGLTAMHTLFLREHNRLCKRIVRKYPDASDEQIYQLARKIVGALIQKVAYEEFLPAVLGNMAPDLTDSAYDENITVSIATEFSGAAYRFGHTMISSRLRMVNKGGKAYRLPLRKGFFRTDFLVDRPYRVNHLLRGFVTQQAQEIDAQLVTDIRNFLFGPPGSGGLDLAALNIQRGRDLGLPPYNDVRVAYNLKPHATFKKVTSDTKLRKGLKKLYGSPDKMDLWVGVLVEDHGANIPVGELLATILQEQFTRLMKGDKFFYLNDPDLSDENLSGIINFKKTGMYEILRRNARVKENTRVFRI